MKRLFFILLILNGFFVFADAVPFKSNEKIELIYNKKSNAKFEKCGIIYRDFETKRLDTFFDCEGSKCMFFDDINSIRLIRSVPDSFRVVFIYKDTILTSPILKENFNYSYHKLLVSENEIQDITPIFGAKYKNYVLALFVTILLELMIAFFYFKRDNLSFVNLNYVIFANLISHPILWILSANVIGSESGIIYGEPLVFIFEAFFIYKFLYPKISKIDAFSLSFKMNVISFFVGGLIYLIATAS